jgi:hypothetical protein
MAALTFRTLMIATALCLGLSMGVANAQHSGGGDSGGGGGGGGSGGSSGGGGGASSAGGGSSGGLGGNSGGDQYTQAECDWYRRFFPMRLPLQCGLVVRR